MTTDVRLQPPGSLNRAGAKKLPLGQRIVWARKRKGISQEAFALRIGTTRRHMIRLEKGQHRPGPALRSRIAEVTGQPESFFSEDEEEGSDLPADLFRAATAFARALSRSRS